MKKLLLILSLFLLGFSQVNALQYEILDDEQIERIEKTFKKIPIEKKEDFWIKILRTLKDMRCNKYKILLEKDNCHQYSNWLWKQNMYNNYIDNNYKNSREFAESNFNKIFQNYSRMLFELEELTSIHLIQYNWEEVIYDIIEK